MQNIDRSFTPVGTKFITNIKLDKNTQKRLAKLYNDQETKYNAVKSQPTDILNAIITHKILKIPIKKQCKSIKQWFGTKRTQIAYNANDDKYVSLLLNNLGNFKAFYKKSGQIKNNKFSKQVLEKGFMWVFDPQQQPKTESFRNTFYEVTGYPDANEESFADILEKDNINKMATNLEKQDEIGLGTDGAGEELEGGGLWGLKNTLKNAKKSAYEV